jgi:hypothetical protein
MRFVSLAVCAMACAAAIFGSACGGELPAEFASQYVPAAEKLAAAYDHATLRGRYSLSFPRDGKEHLARTLDVALRVDGPWMSLDETNRTYFTDGQGEAVPARHLLITPQRALWNFAGETWGEATDRQQEIDYIHSVTQLGWIEGRGRLSLFRDGDDEIAIDAVEESVQDGRPITSVKYHWQYDNEGITVHWTARYDFSPNESWALRKCVQASSVDGEDLSRFVIDIDYNGMQDGVPLVKRIEDVVESGPKFEVSQRRVFDITEVELGTAIDSGS